MTRKTWVLVIASVLVSSIVLEGQVFAEGERKKIVMLSNSTDLGLLLGVLQDPLQNPLPNGINVVHPLSMINAVAIELPFNITVQEGLIDLQNLMLGIPSVVYVVYDDLAVSVLPIIPAFPGVVSLIQDRYDWGLQRIDADVAHQEMPAWTGSGVRVSGLPVRM